VTLTVSFTVLGISCLGLGGGAEAGRALEAMMTMKKSGVAAIEAARRG